MNQKNNQKGRLRDYHYNFHITVKGHIIPPIYENAETEFYCQEGKDEESKEENEELNAHTHVGIKCIERTKGTDILSWTREWAKETLQPQINWHRNFETILGYHMGEGNKKACEPKPTMLIENKNKPGKYRYETIKGAKKIEDLYCYIKRPGMLRNIRDDYMTLHKPERYEGEIKKKRHYIIVGESNKGKSLMISENFQPVYIKMAEKWWDGYEGEENIWYDEEIPQWTLIKNWTNGTKDPKKVEMKGSTIWLPATIKFYITCNSMPWKKFMEENEGEREALCNRFYIMSPEEFRLELMNTMEDPYLWCEQCHTMHKMKSESCKPDQPDVEDILKCEERIERLELPQLNTTSPEPPRNTLPGAPCQTQNPKPNPTPNPTISPYPLRAERVIWEEIEISDSPEYQPSLHGDLQGPPTNHETNGTYID